MAIQQITALALRDKIQSNESFLLLDVREPHEFSFANIAGSMLIPLQQLPARVPEIDIDQEVVVFCHHGMRSQRAAEYLESMGIKKLFNLTGGIDAWSRECDASVMRY